MLLCSSWRAKRYAQLQIPACLRTRSPGTCPLTLLPKIQMATADGSRVETPGNGDCREDTVKEVVAQVGLVRDNLVWRLAKSEVVVDREPLPPALTALNNQ